MANLIQFSKENEHDFQRCLFQLKQLPDRYLPAICQDADHIRTAGKGSCIQLDIHTNEVLSFYFSAHRIIDQHRAVSQTGIGMNGDLIGEWVRINRYLVRIYTIDTCAGGGAGSLPVTFAK